MDSITSAVGHFTSQETRSLFIGAQRDLPISQAMNIFLIHGGSWYEGVWGFQGAGSALVHHMVRCRSTPAQLLTSCLPLPKFLL